jgi:TolB-like protein/DNA-binding winged helix-turn-helix (wHTH) protein/Tfp pilus assembly protein PilF
MFPCYLGCRLVLHSSRSREISMPEVNHPSGLLCFGAFQVDLRTRELRKHGVRLRLQAQPFQVLEMLLRHPGTVVTREEIKGRLWPDDTFGNFDHGLNKAINKIREALADSALHPRYVETVARNGYRFIETVTVVGESVGIPVTEPVAEVPAGGGESTVEPLPDQLLPPQAQNKSLVWKITAACFSLSLILLSFFIWHRELTRGQPPDIRSLAVLPLENLSSDTAQEYFADGMTDELISALGTIHGLRVISRTSAMLYKHAHKPLPEIARELNVDAVIEGTVLRSGERVRITAQLIRANTDEHLWAQTYQGDLRDMLQFQDKVASEIADRIRLTVTSQQRTLLKNARLVNPSALDAYLRGRYFWNKRTEDGLKKAIDYFNQAITKDPNYPQAYSGLADSYALLADWEYGVLAPKLAFPRAEAAAAKALELDNYLGEAHASRALCLQLFDWDWTSAQRELQRAIELSPSYASAYQWYAWNLIVLGRNDEGLVELKKAEALDPLSLIISADLADALVIARRYQESIKQSQKTIEMDPSFPVAHYQMAQALLQLHNTKQAATELQQAIELSRGNPICTSLLAYLYAVSGSQSEARKILGELKDGSARKQANAADIALIYAGLNEKDQAFAWLEKAYEDRVNPSVLLRPAFDSLRSDPRFRDLLHRVGIS